MKFNFARSTNKISDDSMTDTCFGKHEKDEPVQELSASDLATNNESTASPDPNTALKAPPEGGYWAWAGSK